MRARRTLLLMLGTLVFSQSAFGMAHAKSAARQRELDRFETEQSAKRAIERQDWQGAVREYSKLIELVPAAYRKDATEYKCPRASAYAKLGQLESATLDLSFEVDPIADENNLGSRRIPTTCLLARAELEEQKQNIDAAVYYYRLMVRNDCNHDIAAHALIRLKSCPLMAFRVRGIAVADSIAVLKAIHPDIVDDQFRLKACERLCRIPTEEAVVRPKSTGGFYVFPGLLPQKGSRCGGTNPQDTAKYLEDVFGWTMALGDCQDGPNGPCPLACHKPVTATDAGWEVRTVAPDPLHPDCVLVVDQRNPADGPGASPGCKAYRMQVASDGFLRASAPFCTKIPVFNSQAGAPIQISALSHKTSVRHSLIPGTLLHRFLRSKKR